MEALTPLPPTGSQPFSLDEARDQLFKLCRAGQRFSDQLQKVVDSLTSRTADEAWMVEVQDEAQKGVFFAEQHLAQWQAFAGRATDFVDAQRRIGEELAISELQGGAGPSEGAEQAVGDVATASGSGSVATARIIHPELQKFKLEKQAKILGKYGGVPALGMGMQLPRLQKEFILKATGTPAAREIHYSKTEGKDAQFLSEVMQFKLRQGQAGQGQAQGQGQGPAQGQEGAEGGAGGLSEWQAEMSARKGKLRFDGTDDKDMATPCTTTHTAYSAELQDALQQRQAGLAASLAAEAAAAKTPAPPAGPSLASAGVELAALLAKRQPLAQTPEPSAAKDAGDEGQEGTAEWSNTTAPFGSELSAALQQRRASAAAAAAARPPQTPVGAGAAADAAAGEGGEREGRRQVATPATAFPQQRRATHPSTLFSTPQAGGAAGGMQSELLEKLNRRASALAECAGTTQGQ